mmetsp:Transcript_27486/g.62336  ORF Transcript_27486/g.62336 Transcript_27486/m.62336 type:complete len:225 (+) Transcript_27486:401-1075(+)
MNVHAHQRFAQLVDRDDGRRLRYDLIVRVDLGHPDGRWLHPRRMVHVKQHSIVPEEHVPKNDASLLQWRRASHAWLVCARDEEAFVGQHHLLPIDRHVHIAARRLESLVDHLCMSRAEERGRITKVLHEDLKWRLRQQTSVVVGGKHQARCSCVEHSRDDVPLVILCLNHIFATGFLHCLVLLVMKSQNLNRVFRRGSHADGRDTQHKLARRERLEVSHLSSLH